RIQQRSLEGFGCADVRFRAARPNSHREPDTSNDWCGFRGELASCSGILEHVLRHDTKIKSSARGHLDEFRRSTVADASLMPGTFLELGRNLIQGGSDAGTRDNLQFSGFHLTPIDSAIASATGVNLPMMPPDVSGRQSFPRKSRC